MRVHPEAPVSRLITRFIDRVQNQNLSLSQIAEEKLQLLQSITREQRGWVGDLMQMGAAVARSVGGALMTGNTLASEWEGKNQQDFLGGFYHLDDESSTWQNRMGALFRGDQNKFHQLAEKAQFNDGLLSTVQGICRQEVQTLSASRNPILWDGYQDLLRNQIPEASGMQQLAGTLRSHSVIFARNWQEAATGIFGALSACGATGLAHTLVKGTFSRALLNGAFNGVLQVGLQLSSHQGISSILSEDFARQAAQSFVTGAACGVTGSVLQSGFGRLLQNSSLALTNAAGERVFRWATARGTQQAITFAADIETEVRMDSLLKNMSGRRNIQNRLSVGEAVETTAFWDRLVNSAGEFAGDHTTHAYQHFGQHFANSGMQYLQHSPYFQKATWKLAFQQMAYGAVFGAMGDVHKTEPQVWVGALFSRSREKIFTPNEMQVRCEGIQSEGDIRYAIAYLSKLHPPFSELFTAIQVRSIPIRLGKADLDYSYARPTFNGYVDRTSHDYAREIVLHPGATPDVLLHEVLHALPLLEIQRHLQFNAWDVTEFPISDLVFPAVNPHARFAEIREAIFENVRLNETLSFSAQGFLFEKEREQGITPVFHKEMMSNIDNAWKQDGFQGVRDTFPQYLPHYEQNLGLSSILMALIVKVEGRTQLTEEEYQQITRVAQGQFPFQTLLERMQEYLNRHVRKTGAQLAEDFYSLPALLRRVQIHSLADLSANKLAEVIDTIFASVENIENDTGWERVDLANADFIDPSAQPENMPENMEARTSLFGAYAGVVDRIVENPPADLSREELTALVSFTRMLPAEQAQEMATRLLIYLGTGVEDLRVSLGIILHEKGFRNKGQELVTGSVRRTFLHEVAPLILRFMGPQFLRPLLTKEAAQIAAEQQQEASAFQIAALGHFIWEGSAFEAQARALFRHPWLLQSNHWNRLGRLVFEKGDVDSNVEDDKLLGLENHFDENLETEKRFLQNLNRLQEDSLLDDNTRSEIQTIRQDWVRKNREGYSRLLRVFKTLKDSSLLSAIADRAEVLACFSAEEVQEIFKDTPPKQRAIAISLAESKSTRPYSHPEVVGPLVKGFAKSLGEMNQAKENHESVRALYFLAQDLMDHSYLHPNPEGTRPDFQPALEILTRPAFSQKIIEGAAMSDCMHTSFVLPHFFPARFNLEYPHTLGFDPLDPSLQLYWLTRALQVDGPLHYFKQAFSAIQESMNRIQSDRDMNDENLCNLLLVITPHGLQFIHRAQRSGLTEVADRFSKLLFEDLPRLIVPQRIFQNKNDSQDDNNGKKFEQVVGFYTLRAALSWTFQMDSSARIATEQSSEWLRRIREEIARGGELVTLPALRYLAEPFAEANNLSMLQNLFELMIQKSLMEPQQKNITETLQAIENSPLDNETKDHLMAQFTERLFNLIQSFRGIDLNLLHQLRHLFPWRTPFMRANDLPHYPKTEALLICRLAGISELVNPQKDKQDRVRLAAFSAAGLPLQRHADYMAALFADPALAPSLGLLASRRKFREIYTRLGLPASDEIPLQFLSAQVKDFLKTHQATLENLLSGDPNNPETQAGLRLINRILGSELRALAKTQNRRLNAAELWQQSALTTFLLDWTQKQYQSPSRAACTERIQEILFEAGPLELRRLGLGLKIYEGPLSRAERQRLFAQATQHLVFSRRTQKRLDDLRESSDEATEKTFHFLLFSLHYERHPGNMVSDYFLDALEKESDLQQQYRNFLAAQASEHPLVIAEIGLVHESDGIIRGTNWAQFNLQQRFAIYYYGLRFLNRYLREEKNILRLTDGDYFNFDEEAIQRRLANYHAELNPIMEHMDFMELSYTLRKIAEVLAATGWAQRVSNYLDSLDDDSARTFDMDEAIAMAEQDYRNIIAAELRLKMAGTELPEFIRSRQGLEKDLLSYVLAFLHPAQRTLLNERLSTSQTDSERLRALGEASHLEKLLQGASIHPAVPAEYQRHFAIFQEEVPSRDPIDVQNTLNECFFESDKTLLQVDVNHPLKEGTIGGIYPGTFEGRSIVMKIIPNGKWNALHDSLRIVAEIRRMLWANQYAQAGSRATDDFLAFYERSIQEEMHLENDMINAQKLKEILPAGFVVPEYLRELTFLTTAAMLPLPSRRLRELSAEARENFFRRMDEELIPRMIQEGVFHYDLHPGNLGLHENENIVLYDTGRVGILTEEQRVNLYLFHAALAARNLLELPALLRKFGQVRDEQAFARISELLEDLTGIDPMEAIGKIYPKLADYGFVLDDSFHKLLFMFITWEGTKKSFRTADA